MLTRLWLLCHSVLTLAMSGCGPAGDPSPVDFGRFDGQVVAVWDDDGRHMTLREDFFYVDAQNRRWPAPAGAVVDGASIPRAFWTMIGGPFEGRYRNASVVHDVGCVAMRQSWEDVHRMFYEACRCGGVDEQQAKIMYYAVYHFGPRWQTVSETRVESRTTQDGRTVQEPVTVNRMVRIDPPPPSEEDLEQVREFVAEDNPDMAQIQQVNPQTLRRRPRSDRSARARPSERPSDGSTSPRSKTGDNRTGSRPREKSL